MLLILTWYSVKAQIEESQALGSLLSKDPAFKSLLAQNITYPVRAYYKGIYGNVYAGFRVDQKGHIQDIVILNPEKSKSGFENEVKRGLKKLPSFNPKYEGLYVLPIVFGFSVDGRDIVTGYTSSEAYAKGRIVLESLKVIRSRLGPY